jgi:hypothetical protein
MRRLAIAAVLALVLIAGVVGYAVASIPSGDRIYGCYGGPPDATTGPKAFLLLDKERGDCPRGWTEVSWAAD